jgi:hypothetical protein
LAKNYLYKVKSIESRLKIVKEPILQRDQDQKMIKIPSVYDFDFSKQKRRNIVSKSLDFHTDPKKYLSENAPIMKSRFHLRKKSNAIF